jgi:hypothetical protein
MLTAYLRPALFRDPRSTLPESDEACNNAAEDFCRVFSPWANQEYGDEERTKQLAGLLQKALNLAIWLLSQPDSFDFLWTPQDDIRDRGRREIVTLPGMVKTTYEGKRLERQQVIVEATTRRL